MPKRPIQTPLVTSIDGLPGDKMLTLYDVAAVLNLASYSSAYDLVCGGAIEFIRMGKRIRVEVRALRAYIDERRRGGNLRGLKKAI